jgi:hypothetical protein
MLRVFSLIALLAIASLIFACGSNPQTNSNAASNVTSNKNANIPPEFSVSPIPPSANTTPGIPANGVNTLPKGATPTPGIPDPKLANRKLKPGATPTPGIPDPETLKRQMQGLEQPNVNGLAPPGGGMMMKKKPQPVNKPQL